MRTTHTLAILELSPAAASEIETKLRTAGYDHAFLEDGMIDMTGIGVRAGEQPVTVEPVAASDSLPSVDDHRVYAGGIPDVIRVDGYHADSAAGARVEVIDLTSPLERTLATLTLTQARTLAGVGELLVHAADVVEGKDDDFDDADYEGA